MSTELSEQYWARPGAPTVARPGRATELLFVCRRPA
jgi:hypothetical protein